MDAEIPGQRENQGKLDQFRGLKGKAPQGNPALGPMGRISVECYEKQKQDGKTVEEICILTQQPIIEGDDDGHEKKTDQDPLDLLDIKGQLR